jgi:hypothetical protein
MTEIRGTTYFECPLGAVFDFLADPRANEPRYNSVIEGWQQSGWRTLGCVISDQGPSVSDT